MLLCGTQSPTEKVLGFTVMTADGDTLPNLGGAPFRQFYPAYPSLVEGRRRICFSEDIPNIYFSLGTCILTAQPQHDSGSLRIKENSAATGKPDLTRGTFQI